MNDRQKDVLAKLSAAVEENRFDDAQRLLDGLASEAVCFATRSELDADMTLLLREQAEHTAERNGELGVLGRQVREGSRSGAWRPVDGAERLFHLEDANGQSMFFNAAGQLHRMDGPAVVEADGSQGWYSFGRLHRSDGPAVVNANGMRMWYVDGRQHRTDGPAVELADGRCSWWLDDVQLSHEAFLKRTKAGVEMSVDEVGTRTYRNRYGQLHRLDGPAVERANGDKEWWVFDRLHRTDGPAVERADGGREWWVDGLRHRLDGPAVELGDGSRFWYVGGHLSRTDGPAVERADGSKEWWLDGELHREGGFAVEYADGGCECWMNGHLVFVKPVDKQPLRG